MRPIILALLFALLAAAPCAAAAPAQDDSHFLPLTKTAIVAIFTQKLGVKAPKIEAVTGMPEQRSGLEPGDTIWLLHDPAIQLRFVLAANGERIHSLRITVPVVNYRREESERVFAMLSELFLRLFPAWPGAADWPKESLGAAWNASPLMTNVMPKQPDDVIARHSADGIVSATFGVPPDIVVYSVTARQQCVPSTITGNPFSRLVC